MTRFKRLLRYTNWYPPYIGAGIRVKEVDQDYTRFVVQMRMRWFNRNAVGTHFGGSLYSMCDPFYMFIVMANLGSDFIVWDKSAKIEFVSPGRGTVEAVFEISPEQIEEIKQDVLRRGKNTYWFETEVLGEDGKVVAKVEKEVYVRVKNRKKE
ncbi:MAG: DUF4442 domain-containing protein [Bacteroidota bacterium]